MKYELLRSINYNELLTNNKLTNISFKQYGFNINPFV